MDEPDVIDNVTYGEIREVKGVPLRDPKRREGFYAKVTLHDGRILYSSYTWDYIVGRIMAARRGGRSED